MTILSIEIALAMTLLLGSAFFSLSETALVSLSVQKVKRLALHNPKLSAVLLRWLDKPHELLTTILIGNTIINILFASLVTSWTVKFVGTQIFSQIELLVWLAITFLIVIFGEMVPKLIARSSPEKASLFVLPLLFVIKKPMAPLLPAINGFMDFFSERWKTPRAAPGLTFSINELKGLLDEGQGNASVSPDSLGMMQRVLEINDRKAESIMTKLSAVDVVELDPPGKPGRDRDTVLDLIVENGHTRTPIKFNGTIIGFIHTADVLPLIATDDGRDLLTLIRKAMNVRADRSVNDLLQDFKTSEVHAGFVHDQDNHIVGLVTLEDVLEEITGEILDEYDVALQPK